MADQPPASEEPLARLVTVLRDEFQRLYDRRQLPRLDPPEGGRLSGLALNADVTVWSMTGSPAAKEQAWQDFHHRFAGQPIADATNDTRRDNLRPWFRSIGVLRGLGAVTVVAEHYYVCLDHKSEHASFYGHVDEQRNSSTVRLHFFSKAIPREKVGDLTPSQQASYLGYVVCRRGTLPLIGRAMIRVPTDYIDECASVNEPVHLLGQTLSITGVPFMQQDARFAVCADVVAWSIAYTAYRRGVSERE